MTQILFIEGVSGVGKSTLVSRLTQRLRGQGYSVKSWVEFDFTNPIDFYCTAYFLSDEYEDLCNRYPSSVETLRRYTVAAEDVQLVRYYNNDTPLFEQPLLSELWDREFCYEPKNPVPLSEYTRIYKAVWRQYFSTLNQETDYLIFDGKTMREADAQFDWNEKFPRPHGTGGWFAKFWPRSLIRKRQRKRSAAEAQMT